MGYAWVISTHIRATYLSIDETMRQAGIMTTRLRRSARRFFHSHLPKLALLFAMLLSSPWLATPAPAFAADPSVAQTETSAGVLDARAASYLDQLLGEINDRRARAGNGPLMYAGPEANQAVGQYLADLTPRMVAQRACFHGNGNPVSPGWDYVKGSGFSGEARGEVLACPGDNGFWTAPKIADGWWGSPSHWRSLYGDSRVNAIACGTFGAQNGGRAYQTIACVTYKV
jgi:uncharacterized protein YkwD